MARVTIDGTGRYLGKLDKLTGKQMNAIIKSGVYEGAGIIADEIRNQIKRIPLEFEYVGKTAKLDGLNYRQLDGLEEGLSLLTMETVRGFTFTKVAFIGYNEIVTAKWTNGQPNAMIARSVEKGTSFMKPHPFRKRAIAAAKEKAVEAIGKKIDFEISKIFTD